MSAIIPSQRIERHILLLLTCEEAESLRPQSVILMFHIGTSSPGTRPHPPKLAHPLDNQAQGGIMRQWTPGSTCTWMSAA